MAVAIAENGAIGTNAVIGDFVEVGSIDADFSSHTVGAVPLGIARTLASEGVHIPLFASQARIGFETGVAIPACARRTLADSGGRIIHSAEGAVDTDTASPVGASRALALIVLHVESLASGTQLDTSTAIPVETVATTDAGSLGSGVGTRWTGLDTDSVADELVAGTAAAF